MSENINAMLARRSALKKQMVRFTNFIDKACALERDDDKNAEICERLDAIFGIRVEFDNLQTEIEIEQRDDAYADAHENERSEFEGLYFKYIAKAKKLIPVIENEVRSVKSNNSAPVENNNNLNIKLPFINLPEFHGRYDQWSQFKDTFDNLIEKNVTLSNVQKFYYLQAALKGKAAQVIGSLQINSENYDAAWQLLNERFENKKAITHAHIKAIFDLQVISKESHENLRVFLDTFNKNYRALENLGENIGEWSTILIYVLNSKLDISTKKEWEIYAKDITNPKITDFKKFLGQRCDLLETINNKYQGGSFSNQQNNSFPKNKVLITSTNQGLSCHFCKAPHSIYDCKKFSDLSINDRYVEVKKLHLCINCLRPGHSVKDCRSRGCKTCFKKHNLLLHNKGSSESDQNKSNNTSNSNLTVKSEPSSPGLQSNSEVSLNCNQRNSSFVFLSTALIYIYDLNNKPIKCRALLDNGSTSNFITDRLFKKLNLDSANINLPITGINQSVTKINKRTQTTIKSIYNDYNAKLSFLVIDNITDATPNCSIPKAEFNIPETIQLADPQFNIASEIDCLLGASIFFELLCVGMIKLGCKLPSLIKTKLGWIISGEMTAVSSQKIEHCFFVKNDIQSQLERFWEIEEINAKVYSKEESDCEKHFFENMTRDENGRFLVKLPLKENYTNLGDSKQIAIKQFYSLENKLNKNTVLRNEYVKFMNEYLELGHMKEVAKNEINNDSIKYYLPHHSVERERSITTKVRVVFNASSKTSSGLSLNDCLMVGPCIQDDLFAIMIRFRKHDIVITGDVEKMYRMIKICDSHQDLQRIVWRSDPNFDLKHFKLTTLTYGTGPASFIATRCLVQLANENELKFPEECEIMKSDFYVDDLITGADTVEHLLRLIKNINFICKNAGFNLRKWLSNDKEILKGLSESTENNSQYVVLDANSNNAKTLGVQWNAINDNLQYKTTTISSTERVTKRIILSIISQMFDPLGVLGPIIIKAKIILQKLWQLKLEWDESIPTDLHTIWVTLYSQLNYLDTICIPRQVTVKNATYVELHGFSDSSEQAYGACIYIKSKNDSGEIKVNLLCAKSRVAPLKAVSLPRLELCGGLLLAQLMFKVIKCLKMIIGNVYYWTDSSIVLNWISAEPSKWKTFVCNRVSEIQRLTVENGIWSHCPSTLNPADIISRGINPSELQFSDLWWHGPGFLQFDSDKWPKGISNQFTSEDLLEIKLKNACYLIRPQVDFLINRYSSFNKLQRVTAYILRFIHNCKVAKEVRIFDNNLSNSELINSLNVLIKIVQKSEFHDDYNCLSKAKPVSPNSKLVSLNPFFDKDQILRVGGRLNNSLLTYNQKHPVVLPAHSQFTRLVIQNEHIRNLHSGISSTLSYVRQKYWPINGKSTVRGVVKKCITCFRAKPVIKNQIMGDLPKSRITPSRPFYSCGVDYAGPYLIKDSTFQNRRFIKAYICVFVCMCTKALHLELVTGMTTDSFLNALQRFVSRRGVCAEINSDNGSNFVGAHNDLTKICEILKGDKIKNFSLSNNIKWNFIPAKSPHFGGLWESSVKSVKYYLSRILTDIKLTYEEFNTLLAKIEGILNSRPILPLSSDLEDFDVLTPGHFLIGGPINALPELPVENVSFNRLKTRFALINKLTQQFWRQWKRSYLHTLQQRSKWRFETKFETLVGSLVLLVEDDTPPCVWRLGRITEVHPGADQIVRVVTVKTLNGHLKRAINRVCILPIGEEIKDGERDTN